MFNHQAAVPLGGRRLSFSGLLYLTSLPGHAHWVLRTERPNPQVHQQPFNYPFSRTGRTETHGAFEEESDLGLKLRLQ